MNFITLEEEDFREFADQSPYKSFMQTPEIAKYRAENDWTTYYLGVEESGTLKAATMLVAKPTFLGKSTFIAPGGPLLDIEDTDLTSFFFKHLRRYIKQHNGFSLHIDPYYELVERDRNGEPIKDGFNHQKALQNLTSLGFKAAPSTQPQYLFAMDLGDRTPDQIFTALKRNTRNHIRKADKAGVKVRELKREELSIFKQITESTSKRRNFEDRPLSYYEQMYDLFTPRNEIKFLVAECDLGEDSKEESDDKPSKQTNKNVEDKKSPVPLSAAMFMLYGDEVIYLFSGSDEKYMKEYNAQYAIQWHIIKYAAEQKFKRYNFYGISGLPKDGELDGIYEFKKGFAPDSFGHVIELIGSFETPTNQPFYRLHHLLSRLKHH